MKITVDLANARDFILELLNDENGISSESYEALHVLFEGIQELNDIWEAVDATDGRFYLSEEDADDLS